MGTTPRRAKRTASRGFATRTEERRHRMRQRYATAATAEDQAAAAWDWWRSSVQHASEGARAGLLLAMARTLAAEAEAIERSDAA